MILSSHIAILIINISLSQKIYCELYKKSQLFNAYAAINHKRYLFDGFDYIISYNYQ